MLDMYVVVEIQGHQRIVKQGDEIIVDHIDQEVGAKVSFPTVLCTFDATGGAVHMWAPYLAGSEVKAEVKLQRRGPKVTAFKFQGKKRYQKTKGFRPHQTVLAIDSIVTNVK